ncbi:MAG: hypothetical protein DME65_06830 [Verrucomicrobia bacterium]|nr:MAG: hypothetical protein DME65_06830 [Verrucomicrobiota bacterium]
MKLSIEAKVAAAVAIAFAALSLGAIAKEQSDNGNAGRRQTSVQTSDRYVPARPDSQRQFLAQY